MASEVEKVMVQLERFTSRLIIKIVLDVTANLIETNPVDTSWSRANWVPQIGAPFSADLTNVTPSSQAAAGASATQAAGLASVVSGYSLGPAVYISNNVPYVSDLNNGSSPQQPPGFIQRAIAKAITIDILSLRT